MPSLRRIDPLASISRSSSQEQVKASWHGWTRGAPTTVVKKPASLVSGARVVLQERRQLLKQVEVPANIELRPYFPQLTVLRYATVFLSHAGMDSTMELLSDAVPLVAVPQMFEQEVNAHRVAELGLSRRLDPSILSAHLRATVDEVATNKEIHNNLSTMSKIVREAGGAAATAIETHLAD